MYIAYTSVKCIVYKILYTMTESNAITMMIVIPRRTTGIILGTQNKTHAHPTDYNMMCTQRGIIIMYIFIASGV